MVCNNTKDDEAQPDLILDIVPKVILGLELSLQPREATTFQMQFNPQIVWMVAAPGRLDNLDRALDRRDGLRRVEGPSAGGVGTMHGSPPPLCRQRVR